MSTKAEQATGLAQMELGSPYIFGDEGPNTFDCSGLMQYVYGQLGIKLPRTAREQQKWAQPVKAPAPGDLVFYGRPATHVGLYVGGGRMIDASSSKDRVVLRDVWGTPTSYGRVPGAGASVAGAVGAVVTAPFRAAGNAVGDTISGWLGGARNIALELAVAGLGLALVGFGLFRAVTTPARKAVTDVTGVKL